MKIGNKILFFDSLDSTNNYIKDHVEMLKSGTLVCTEYQTRGRGRGYKSWQSQRSSGLLFSILLKENIEIENIPMYLYLPAVIMTRLLREHYHINAGIKWPNDILINNRKIAGILVESRLQQSTTQYLIIGIGINIYKPNTNKEHEIAYLSTLTEENPDKLCFLYKFITLYNDLITNFNATSSLFSQVIRDWNHYNLLYNKVIEITLKGAKHRYIFKGLDSLGKPLVQVNDAVQSLQNVEDITCFWQ